MVWKRGLSLGLALALGGSSAWAQAPAMNGAPPAMPSPAQSMPSVAPAMPSVAPAMPSMAPAMPSMTPAMPSTVDGGMPVSSEGNGGEAKSDPAPEDPGYGPTPFLKVNILQDLLCPDKDTRFKIGAWIEADYNYRNTGNGINNIAPVMNRFGNEYEQRQYGLYLARNLTSDWSWGFNIIALGGADASFLNPTAGWYHNNDPRMGFNFTDANLTFHMPILTEGGIDVKAGRQTTILGPMGALAWQRPFASSDYAWYNLEEGRYTGVSAITHVNKQLDIYTGVEIGGWGVWFDVPGNDVCGLANITYWLDEDAKKCKVWTTCLTGPTGHENHGGNTTIFELGLLINWTDRCYQIVDNQNCWSRAPVFGPAASFYNERAYDVYNYLGYRLTKEVDVTHRMEWYKDVDGGGYAGGFGVPHTTYLETTLGVNYHPVKWLEFRPEVRYDNASHPNFGPNNDRRHQVDCCAEVLLKF